MLEHERMELKELRDEIRQTADEAERLRRVLVEVGMLLPTPKSRKAADAKPNHP